LGIFLECALHALIRFPYHRRNVALYLAHLPAFGTGADPAGLGWMSVSDLPAVNASLNALATVLLTAGFVCIKQKRIAAHRACMVAAFAVSCVFLVTYVIHKILMRGVHTPFGGEGAIRTIYYAMLISHIILAIVIVPLAIVTLSRAAAGRFAVHKKWARWTFPLWYYVSVTGVLVYFFLYQWFPHK
jgi:putative membrane protein